MAKSPQWHTSSVSVAGVEVALRRAGTGQPLLIAHHDFGTLPQLPFYDLLAQRFDVLIPEHPGFGRSQRPEWMRSVRDLAVLYRCLLAQLTIERPILVGLGFGGWVTAEMACMAPRDLERLVLVGAMGIKPAQGYILDQALIGYIDYARSAFHQSAAFDAAYGAEPTNDQLELWDICREMCFRIAWKPYMHSPTLPHLLKSMPAPTLLVWGNEDKVVPIDASTRYLESLPDARLERVSDCGHAVDMEKPEILNTLIEQFVTASGKPSAGAA